MRLFTMTVVVVFSFAYRTGTLSKERNSAIARAVESSADAIFITGIDGRIRYVNPAFSRMTGYAAQEATGKTPHSTKTCGARSLRARSSPVR